MGAGDIEKVDRGVARRYIFVMHRRLPYESEQLLAELTSWIEWRYAASEERLVLTSAPTSLPSVLQRWMPGAVWRLAWLGSGTAILFGLAPSGHPRRYFVVQHDAVKAHREGVFEKLAEGSWSRVEGDSLEPEAQSMLECEIVMLGGYRRRSRLRPVVGSLATASRDQDMRLHGTG